MAVPSVTVTLPPPLGIAVGPPLCDVVPLFTVTDTVPLPQAAAMPATVTLATLLPDRFCVRVTPSLSHGVDALPLLTLPLVTTRVAPAATSTTKSTAPDEPMRRNAVTGSWWHGARAASALVDHHVHVGHRRRGDRARDRDRRRRGTDRDGRARAQAGGAAVGQHPVDRLAVAPGG